MGDIKDSVFVSEKDTNGPKLGFIDSLTVWINKPHVVNRRLCGAKINHFIFLEKERLSEKLTELFQINGESAEKSNDKEAEHSLLEVENLQEISESEVAVITRNLISKQGKSSNDITEIIVVEGKYGKKGNINI